MNSRAPTMNPSDAATLVDVAQRIVPASWGLDGFVAVNPLGGLEDLPFEHAVARAADLFDARCYPAVDVGREHGPGRVRTPSIELVRRGTAGVADLADALVAHWCATYIAGSLRVPDGVDGLFHTWKTIAAYDTDLRRMAGPHVGTRIRELPDSAAAAVAFLLHRLDVGEDDAVAYLEAQLCRLPGWAAVMARRDVSSQRREMVEFIAVRLAIERMLVDADQPSQLLPAQSAMTGAQADDSEMAAARLAAAEADFRDHLLSMVVGNEPARADAGVAPNDANLLAQVVCCIDVRSEGLRRHLEEIGRYETLGFAGFFGLPIAVRSATWSAAVASCPVILDPKATIEEHVVEGALPIVENRDLAHRSFHSAKSSAASGFVLADSAGWVLGLRSVAQSLAPALYQRAKDVVHRVVSRPVRTRFAVDPTDSSPGVGLSTDEQAGLALGALTAMGLTSGFADLVVICGHRSMNQNNPYRSALDCGACAGHPGGPNACILAAICNQADVRSRLLDHGVAIGDHTWFVAAEHETTDDTVAFFDVDDLPAAALERLEIVRQDLAAAGHANRLERRASFPSPPLPWRTATRSADPAQVVPDWGLARCAAIVVGPRSLTAGLDLERRVFLHSYRPHDDPDGVVLEAVMTGPVVVAHWICSQYYFSTVDPHCFGAGSKPLHNVIGRVGVSEGIGVDVRIGLPLESVWFDGQPVHEPLRLLVVVDAPASRVDGVVARNPVLRRLFDHGWAHVVARDPQNALGFVCRSRSGSWTPWVPENDRTTTAASYDLS